MIVTLCDNCHEQGPLTAITVTFNSSPPKARTWHWCETCRSALWEQRFADLDARKNDRVSETVKLW